MTLPPLSEILDALPVIFSLVLIESLLSVDNAIAIAAMARHLPEHQQKLALKFGMLGAYLFRGICMWAAAWIIANPGLKMAGAVFLVHLMASHFCTLEAPEEEVSVDLSQRGFIATVLAIELMDLSLSVDNVVAAVAISPKLWVVCAGVFLGILALRFVAGYCLKLMEQFPILEHAAFLLIGYVGLILAAELTWHVEVSSLEKFGGIVVILGLALLYERSKPVQTALTPVFHLLHWPFKIYATVTGFLLSVVSAPFRGIGWVWRKWRSKATGG